MLAWPWPSLASPLLGFYAHLGFLNGATGHQLSPVARTCRSWILWVQLSFALASAGRSWWCKRLQILVLPCLQILVFLCLQILVQLQIVVDSFLDQTWRCKRENGGVRS